MDSISADLDSSGYLNEFNVRYNDEDGTNKQEMREDLAEKLRNLKDLSLSNPNSSISRSVSISADEIPKGAAARKK